MSGLATRLAALPPDRQRLLLQAVEGEGGPAGVHPLSFAQERLWFLDQLTPGSALYNLTAPVRLCGPVDVAALARSRDEIERRHEILRTTYVSLAGHPIQIVGPAVPRPLPVVDLGALPAAGREAAARAVAEDEARSPFDLRHGPLARLTLLRLEDRDHLLLLTLHHIAADGWSVGVFLREFLTLYSAFREGRPSPLPDLPVQYSDFARWQRRGLQGERLEAELEHWRQCLAGAPPELDLPADRPRPPVPSFRGTLEPVAVPAEAADRLRALAGRHGATLFMTVLAAWNTLLLRYTGQEDLVVGTVVANRDRAEVEGLIGFFVNTLVLRTGLAGDPTFLDLLERVRAVALVAYAHQDLPFERLVEALHPERNVSRSPIFQVAFDLQSLSGSAGPVGPAISATDLELRGVEVTTGTAKFDLRLVLADTGPGQGLSGGVEYATDLFDASTAARIARHCEAWLEAIAAHPERRLSELTGLLPAERQAALLDANDTGPGIALEGGLYARLAAWAERTPEALAVACGEDRLTCRDLYGRADRLAAHLRGLGAGPEVRIGICLERSPEMIVAMLAVLAAGAAWVPLDPSNPPERLGFLLADARVPVLVTRRGILDRLPDVDARTVMLDGGWLDTLPTAERVEAGLSGDGLAYVLYTSGSTGRPKGVMVTRRGLANYLAWSLQTYEVVSDDGGAGALVHTSFSFDLTLTGLLVPLLAGRPVRLLPDGDSLDALASALRASRDLSLVKLTPAHLEVLRPQIGAAEAAGRTRALVIGGEALSFEALSFWRQHAPETRLINEYGPTETVVGCCVHQVEPGDPAAGPVPIGRPITGLRLYVIDRALLPSPVGAVGELYIGGAGVARGYLGRPELTAERFVPDPFGGPGDRLYRTGDLGRRRADGSLVYLGRTDDQVKVRGFRVELGEIETLLQEQPDVERAAVVAQGSSTGDRRIAAFVVPRPGTAPGEREIKARLAERLPSYMVPSRVTVVAELPLTHAGKLDRAALAALPSDGIGAASTGGTAVEPPRTETEEAVAAVWREVLGLAAVGRHDNFFDLGGHSLLLVQVHARLREALGVEIALMDLFQYPSVHSLAGFLHRKLRGEDLEEEPPSPMETAAVDPGDGIAVVGMAVRVPGAADPDQLWRNLCDGVEAVTFFTDEELLAAGVDPRLIADPRYVKGKASLPGIDLFDAGFFRIPPKQAAILDPQHRVFLECAWEALENSGYGAAEGRGTTGVFAGGGASSYALLLQSHPELVDSGVQANLGNDKDHLTTRVAYLLNLEGPGVTVQTACSSSLVAVHLACQSLLQGECDMALAGGVSLDLQPTSGYLYQESGILSPDGHCRPFDARARGTVGGSGAGVVVLKRLADALAAGDTVHAVIRGSAINNDGALKVGYTAPRAEGQARVILAAQRRAGVRPDEISYVEAHGTGTELGDPIEVAALTQAFRTGTARTGFCALGSVKSNLGHLDTASGVVGLIKTALALAQRTLPPTLHFERPNPRTDLAGSPFYVNARLTPWPDGGEKRRAGVSSFGIGGTNAHVVVEEAPAASTAPVSASTRPWQVLLLSARTESALEAATGRLADHLQRHPEIGLADAAYTLRVGRQVFSHRRAVVCRDRDDALAALDLRTIERVTTLHREAEDQPFSFLFPGQGSQAVGMGRGLYESEPVFRRELDRCAEILAPSLGFDLREALYPPASQASKEAEAAERLATTAVAQPALFAVEYALARLWMSWLGRPAAMLGHSLGEYVAACLAGVFSLEDALTLVAARGRLMQETAPGAMLAVPLSAEQAQPYLGGDLSLAVVNGPFRCVLAGPVRSVEAVEAKLAGEGLSCRRLPAAHAFHSSLMEPVLERFADEVRRVDLKPPRLPYISNLTGTWITAAEATRVSTWVEHLRRTVRFDEGLGEMWRSASGVLLEVGPGHTLTALANRQSSRPAEREALATLADPREGGEGGEEGRVLAASLGRLWQQGVRVDWTAFQAGEPRRRVPLPAYPFERQRYWVDGIGAAASRRPRASGEAAAEQGRFTVPTWLRSEETPPAATGSVPKWLVFRDGLGLGAGLVRRLVQEGRTVVAVAAGSRFARVGPDEYVLDPRSADDHAALFRDLNATGRAPGVVAHLWNVTGSSDLRHLARAFRAAGIHGPCRIGLVSTNAASVTGDEPLDPAKAMALALCTSPPPDAPNLTWHAVDVVAPEPGSRQEAWLVDRLMAELGGASPAVAAYRGRHRWVQGSRAVRLDAGAMELREDGAFLVDRGLSPAGFGFARALARNARARLTLLEPDGLPPREEWPLWLAGEAPALPVGPEDRLPLDLDAEDTFLRALHEGLERDLAVKLLGDYEGLEAALNRLSSLHVLEYFRRGGIDTAPGRVHAREDLRRALRVLPQFTRFFEAFLDWLAEDGWIEVDEGSVRFTGAAEGEAEGFSAEVLDRYPEFRGMVRLLDHCARHYGPALSGDLPAIGVLYPEGRSDVLDEADRDTATSNHEGLYIRLLARFVAGLARRTDGRRLRILEVGGGTATLTRALISELRGVDVDYLFTDLGKAFVRAAETEAAEQGLRGFSFQVFDISRDPVAQGIDPYAFDVVVGLNVVHATRDLGETVGNLRRLLVPGGLLGMIETVKPSRWVDMVWGLAEGWWSYEDAEIRRSSPLVGLATWERVMQGQGYSRIAIFPDETPPRQDIGLILGQQPDSLDDPEYRERAADRRARRESETRERVRRAFELEELGATIEVIAEAGVIAAARRRIGALNGLALLLDGGLPAVSEVRDLESLVDELDFALLSLAPAGPETEAAAAFWGAFARRHGLEERGGRVRFVHWREGHPSPEDCEDALPRVLAGELPEVIVALARPAAAEAPADEARDPAATAAWTETERAVAGIWQDLLGTEVNLHDNFFELGGDSLVALSLTSRLRDNLHVEVPMRRILEAPTVMDLAALVEQTRASSAPAVRLNRASLPPTVVEIQAGQGPRVPFFTVHAAGGNILCYYNLARYLGADRPVYALQAPGLEGERTAFHRLEDLAAHHVDAIRRVQPHGPYLLGGWSAGGTIAFEMALQLQRLGEEILLVALMDTYAPKSGEELDELRMLMWQVWRFRLSLPIEELLPLASFEEQLDHVVGRAMEAGIVPPHIDRIQAHRLLAIELGTLRAMLNYRPEVLDGPLVYFHCEEGTDFGDFERLWPHINELDHAAGWIEFTTRTMPVHVVPGDHAALMEEPGVGVMGEHLRACIARLEAAAGGAGGEAGVPGLGNGVPVHPMFAEEAVDE